MREQCVPGSLSSSPAQEPENEAPVVAAPVVAAPVVIALASFPGSCVGGEKRAWYTLFAHAQFSQDFREFGNSRKICSVTLTSARHADFSRIKDACH